VPRPEIITPTFLGIINLAVPSLTLAVLAGIAQFVQTKMMTPKTSKAKQGGQMSQFSAMFQKQMLYFFPVFTVFILWKLPSAIGLYWIVTSLFSIGQQYLVLKRQTPAGLEPDQR
jgi:YidC/Oxa1 family membrane protein insertase